MTQDSYRQPIQGFRIIDRLGSGAMGSVYRARQVGLERDVALKVVRRDGVSASSLERFRKEARLLAQLNHPNIVRVFEMGEDGVYLFLAMELVHGRSLKDLLAEHGRLPEATVLAIGEKVARGLAHASEQGIVHRDIKPGNILVGRKGIIKLSDFGLAMAGVERSLTRSGQTVGTPQYMAPEQTRHSRKVDVRSDLFSLGAALYHALTGVPPFRGESVAEVLTSLLFDVPEKPEDIVPGLNRGTSRVLAKLLAKRPNRRYAKPDDLVQDLILVRASAEGELDASGELGIDWRESGVSDRAWYRRPETMVLGGTLAIGLLSTFLFLGSDDSTGESKDDAPDPTSLLVAGWYRQLEEKEDPLLLYKQVDAARLAGRVSESEATPLMNSSLDLVLAEKQRRLEKIRLRVIEAFESGEPKRAGQILDQDLATLAEPGLPAKLQAALTKESSRLRHSWTEILGVFEEKLSVAASNRQESLTPESLATGEPTLFPIDVEWGETLQGRTGPEAFTIASKNKVQERIAKPLLEAWDRKLMMLRLQSVQEQDDLIRDVRNAVLDESEKLAAQWRESGPSSESPQRVVQALIEQTHALITGDPSSRPLAESQVRELNNESVAILLEATRQFELTQRTRRRTEVLDLLLPLLHGRDYISAEGVLRGRTDLDETFKGEWEARIRRLKRVPKLAMDRLRDQVGTRISIDRWSGELEQFAQGRLHLSTLIEPISFEDLTPSAIAGLASETEDADPLGVTEWLYFEDAIAAAHESLRLAPQTEERRWVGQRITQKFAQMAEEARLAAADVVTLWNQAEQASEQGRKLEAVKLYEQVLEHAWIRKQDLYDRLPQTVQVKPTAKRKLKSLRTAIEEESERSQLASLFRGAIRVDQDRRVTLTYVFEAASEVKDFSLARNYEWVDGGLKGVRPSPKFDMYRASRGPELDIALDLDHDFSITLVMTTDFEQGTPEFFGLRAMGLCFGVKTPEDVTNDGQSNYWWSSLDAFEDHFTHHVLDKKRRSNHPIRSVPRLVGGGTYTFSLQYQAEAKEVLFLVDDVPYYRLSDVDRSTVERVIGVEFRASVPVTFEELLVSGHLDSRWLRKKRES